MNDYSNVLLIGGGPGNRGLAFDLQSRGKSVLIYTHKDHQTARRTIEQRGYEGVRDGDKYVKMSLDFTSDAEKAAAFSRIIVMSLRGDVHDEIWKEFRGVDLSRHFIFFVPGSCEQMNLQGKVEFLGICQTTSTPLCARAHSDGIQIIGRKGALFVSTSSPEMVPLAADLLNVKVYQTFNEIDHETMNGGGIFHPWLMLGNADRIRRGEKFQFYREGLTESVIKNMNECYDVVRQVRRELGFGDTTLLEVINAHYPEDFASVADFGRRSATHQDFPSPNALTSRMLVEDIVVHYVWWWELATKIGVDAAPLERAIRKAGELLGRDFFREGARMQRYGLDEVRSEQFIERFGKQAVAA